MSSAGVITDQDPMGLLGVVLRERFRLEWVVACGGFGQVYRALDLALKKPAAVKVLHNAAGTRDAATLLAELGEEARRQAAIDHPAVVRVLDLGVITTPAGASLPWMALEWVEGHTLASAMRERPGGAPLAQCLATLRPVFEALAQAHENGIVHRDIKPANIMLAVQEGPARRRDGRPATRLLDFGIAKVMAPDEQRRPGGETETRPGETAFTVRWAAPEQVGGKRTGPWTDVHAMALVMVAMVTGKDPFPGDDVLEVLPKVLDERRPTPGRFGVDVGPAEAVFERALALRHPDRYPDAGAFLDALDAALGTSPPAPVVELPARPAEDSAAPSIELLEGTASSDSGVVAPREDTAPALARPKRWGLLLTAGALVLAVPLMVYVVREAAPPADPVARPAPTTVTRPLRPDPAPAVGAPATSAPDATAAPARDEVAAPDASAATQEADATPDAGRRRHGAQQRRQPPSPTPEPQAPAVVAPDVTATVPSQPRHRYDPGVLMTSDGGVAR